MQNAISRRSFIAAIPLAIGALATLGGCGEDSGGEVLDLTGTWNNYDDYTGRTYMTAVVEGDEITVYWGEDISNIFSVFWAGSYEAPNEVTDSWSWESKKDATRYGFATYPSDSETITFTYKNGVLTFDAISNGIYGKEEMRCISGQQAGVATSENEEEEEGKIKYAYIVQRNEDGTFTTTEIDPDMDTSDITDAVVTTGSIYDYLPESIIQALIDDALQDAMDNYDEYLAARHKKLGLE